MNRAVEDAGYHAFLPGEAKQEPKTDEMAEMKLRIGVSAAMSLSSVFVVTSALRLRYFKQTTPEAPANIKEEPKMETAIRVNGMMCTHCKARVEKVCKGVPGVEEAVVDLEAKTVTVTGNADIAAVKQAICDADYEVVE